MTIRRNLSVLLALAASAGTASLATAQAPDIRNIRPVVMLLVDSSGSMEYRTDYAGENYTTDCAGGACFPECNVPGNPPVLPTAITPANVAQYKNRWTTVVEALTGSLPNFSCTRYPGDVGRLRQTQNLPPGAGFAFTYDEGYDLPFNRIDTSVFGTQLRDGILDSYRERVKFGLMTFDGVPGITSVRDLTALSLAQVALFGGVEGGFSYGPNRQLVYNGCTEVKYINNGAKNEGAAEGRLVSVGDDNPATLPDLDTINSSIQDALIAVRPHGATPIAGLLDDFRVYIKGEGASHPPHTDVADPVTNAAGGDPYFQCRPRFGLLLTDGRPDADFRDPPFDCDDGGSTAGLNHVCPYEPAEDIAADLCQYSSSTDSCSRDAGGVIDGLFVVALAVNNNAALDRLDRIAVAGGERSGMVDPSGNIRAAYLANDLDTLKSALSAALDRAAPGATTRTVPAFANVVAGPSRGQYQFGTGFRVSEGVDPITNQLRPWTGVLERKRYFCGSTGATPEDAVIDDTDRFQVALNQQATRRLYTVLPPAPTPGNPSPETGWFQGDITQWHSIPNGTGTPPEVSPTPSITPVTGAELVDFNVGNAALFTPSLHTIDDAESVEVMNWMLGAPGTVRAERKLGGIYHSSPIISGPPNADAADESFNYFRQEPAIATRPTVLYVATIDGILHAFSVADFDVPATGLSVRGGEELWGFIPPALLPRLGASRSSYQVLFDGTPVVKEVYLRRSPGQGADARQYRTVLVAPIGGEAGYVALDVTDPMTPRFLWQFNLPDHFSRTLAQPTITQILMKTDTGIEERAVAILAAGDGEVDPILAAANPEGCDFAHKFNPTNFEAAQGGDSTGNVTGTERGQCWRSKRGRALAMVDVATGKLIRLFSEENPDDAVDEPINGAISVFPGGQALVSTRAFTTGGSGRVLRVDYSSPDPAAWKLEVFFDTFFDYGGPASLTRQPARHAPVISTDESGNVVVIQGTGDITNLEGNASNRVVSLKEKLICNTSTACDWRVSLNWLEKLEDGGQVTGPIELFDGNVYFATFHSRSNATNACEYGYSLLWGLSYLRAPATTGNPNPGPEPKPMLEISPNVYEKNTSADPFTNQIVMGVGVTQRPSCFTTEVDPYAPGRERITGAGGGGFVLTAHASGAQTGSDGGAIRVVSQTLPAPRMVTRASGIAGSAD